MLRIDPYRVDWRDPTGVWHLGESLEGDERIPMSEGERARFMSLLPGDPGELTEEQVGWPEYIPFFGPQRYGPTHDGHFIVGRITSERFPFRRYDVVDREGRRVATFSLEHDLRLLTLTRRWLYATREDDDGIQYLRRYPWPPRSWR